MLLSRNARPVLARLKFPSTLSRTMASAASDSSSSSSSKIPPHTSHSERTASQRRAKDLYPTTIREITQPTPEVRFIDFQVSPPGTPFNFKAGQWVDTYTPASEQPGGFSIVSAPAQGKEEGTFRLAIQKADKNPAAAYLWRPIADLLPGPPPPPPSTSQSRSMPPVTSNDVPSPSVDISVRVGGEFTFPPLNFRRLKGRVQQVTLIAGGIGANPLIAILGALRDSRAPLAVRMLYGIKSAERALYLDQLADLCQESSPSSSPPSPTTKLGAGGIGLDLAIFCSESAETEGLPGVVFHRRFGEADLDDTLAEERDTNLYYICGPAEMTDFVQEYLLAKGVDKDLVQTERWW